MQPEQQRILGYFIEEAKEHLQTIESALLNLQSVANDQEHLNEVFRAAHSVKGGAAMLGLHSMQHISHRLEDYFKVLKEHTVPVDAKLESLFFKGFDVLNLLTQELESSYEIPEEMETKALSDVEPVFNELQEHLIPSQLRGAHLRAGADKPGKGKEQRKGADHDVAIDAHHADEFGAVHHLGE